ncbi:hypothetical protein Anapl_07661 [Anas platyrhynchos]|uniref:Uncharacterized protein n=1 Tax=Anas platyrhynchos TaxID=8839 RepID=R0KAJ6_ANAPL|nr:hypothetical protein Anapl_07661 [Anas platyrhynchos]
MTTTRPAVKATSSRQRPCFERSGISWGNPRAAAKHEPQFLPFIMHMLRTGRGGSSCSIARGCSRPRRAAGLLQQGPGAPGCFQPGCFTTDNSCRQRQGEVESRATACQGLQLPLCSTTASDVLKSITKPHLQETKAVVCLPFHPPKCGIFKQTVSRENKASVPSSFQPSLQRTVFSPVGSEATSKESSPPKNNLFFQQDVQMKKAMVLQCCVSLKSRQNSFLLCKLKQASAVMLI